jgi:hypothetical protein
VREDKKNDTDTATVYLTLHDQNGLPVLHHTCRLNTSNTLKVDTIRLVASRRMFNKPVSIAGSKVLKQGVTVLNRQYRPKLFIVPTLSVVREDKKNDTDTALYEKKKQTEEKAQWYGGRNINDRR